MPLVSATLTEQFPAWNNYLDVPNDLKPWLRIDPTNTIDDTRLQLVLDASCQWVQNYLTQPVAPTQFFRRFNGWQGLGGSFIMLPYFPVLQVINLTEWWGMNGPHTLTEQIPSNQTSQDAFQVIPTTGRITRVFVGMVQRPFFPGQRNIECTWIAGFNPTPTQIKLATLELAAHFWRNTQETPRWFSAGTSDGGYSPGNTGNLWPAVPNRVVELLEPFRQVSLG